MSSISQPGASKSANELQQKWGPALVIMLCVIAAYLPALRDQLIWDDDLNLTQNMSLRYLGGLWQIWTNLSATPQYYPLTYSSLWLDYHLWGLNPLPYHAENILLHSFSAALVWLVLRRLKVPGAWLGAGLFALHPICVESVAWVTERRNTLAGVFFLASILSAIRFWLPPIPSIPNEIEQSTKASPLRFGRWKFYWLALFLYLCALWSKTAVVGLPAVILLLVWWKRGRLVWKDVILVLPFLALGLALSLITISVEHQIIVGDLDVYSGKLSGVQKVLLSGRVFWFYLLKLAWPYPLMTVYPRWTINSASWPALATVITAAVGWLVMWYRRRNSARAVLVAVGYFVILLTPALGFFNVAWFRYSFVADHFQYLAAIGPLALASAGITVAFSRFSGKNLLPTRILSGALLVTAGVLTWRQCGVYHNPETLWRDTLAHNPKAWMAHHNLGMFLSERGRFKDADYHYRQAIELRPTDHVAYYDLGLEAAIQGNLSQAARYFSNVLEIAPSFGLGYYQLGNVLTRNGDTNEAIQDYTKAIQVSPSLAQARFNLACALARKGEMDHAIREFTEIERTAPRFAAAPLTLGNILAAQGKMNEAIDQYQKALSADPNSFEALMALGKALAGQNQLEKAIACYERALQSDPKRQVVHYNLAVLLGRLGRTEEAQAQMAEAQRLEPGASPSQ